MSVEEAAQSGLDASGNLIDSEHPWLGLDSFSEDTRQFFHGREEEIAELARRVQRKNLTILFGQSGLGKTSILRAGIVPRLRREGYCPVYVRIDYSRDTPAPSEQIKQAIFRATEASGRWTQPGSAVHGESLWEFLHHRDDVLRDAEGRTVIPLLIFDQFEEIFTLAQDDDFGRKRAAEFVEDLADLVENRPPAALQVKLEKDDSVIESFDFDRADYRLLIALREDYLAHLEGFKGVMPSITQNRMRLARMTGTQALAAVVKPGGKLVSQEVAEAIVRFVAGGAELRNAEVEPSLLSLVCRELNNARVAQNRSEISADVLAGSHESILTEFYERALKDQPEGVRRFIEDEMLTESGFRESLAEERVLRAFTAAGAASDALAKLVNRRLLRIEERLDVRRVELTHDVLCPVVKASRDRRHEREKSEAAQRELAAQRERELATRKALVRARRIAAGSAALAVIALAGAVFGFVNLQRAREAQEKTQQARVLAESARSEAEKLIVYLLDDFYLELEPVGRLDIVAKLSKRAVNYYAALPPELHNPESERTRALALVRYGFTQRYTNNLEEAQKALDDAIAELKKLRAAGDTSDAATIGLALGLSARGRVYDSQNDMVHAAPLAEEAVHVIETPATQPGASVAMRRAYAQVAIYMGFTRMRIGEPAEAVKWLDRSREAFRSIDGLKLDDLAAAAGFAEATSWKVDSLGDLGRSDDLKAASEEGIKVATAVLERRPGHMGALRSRALLNAGMANFDTRELRPRAALVEGESAARDWEALLKVDPDNAIAWSNLAASMGYQIFALWAMGRTHESFERANALVRRMPSDDAHRYIAASSLAFGSGFGAVWAAEVGDMPLSAQWLERHRRYAETTYERAPKGGFYRRYFPEQTARFEISIDEAKSDYAAMRQHSQASIERLKQIPTTTEGQRRTLLPLTALAHGNLASSCIYLRDYAAAEVAAREALRIQLALPIQNMDDEQAVAFYQMLLGIALAREGRLPEARATLEPALAMHRKLMARGTDDLTEHLSWATTLYASALANPAQASAQLAEAQHIIAAFPPDMMQRHGVKVVRDWIAAEAKAKRS
jgi:tetratricopeptide (TPR) repeat protein